MNIMKQKKGTLGVGVAVIIGVIALVIRFGAKFTKNFLFGIKEKAIFSKSNGANFNYFSKGQTATLNAKEMQDSGCYYEC